MNSARLWGLAITCLWTTNATAQNTSARTVEPDTLLLADVLPFAPFARPSRFLPNNPKLAMYEAEVNVPVYFWSRTRGLQAGTDEKCFGTTFGRVSGCTIVFIPHFVLRQLDGEYAHSAPVRTPTFNPTFEFNHFSWGTPRDEYVSLVGLAVRLAHYSNGSDGCLYANRTGTDCTMLVPDSAATINRLNGSFSTHYVEFAAQVAQLNFDPMGIERHAALYEMAFRWNPGGWVGERGGMDRELAELYGRTSFRLRYGHRWRTRLGRLDPSIHAEVEYDRAIGRPDSIVSDRVSAGITVWSPHLYGLGVGLRYARGSDYYNIAFSQTIQDRFSIGLIIDHTRAITHTIAAAREVLKRRR